MHGISLMSFGNSCAPEMYCRKYKATYKKIAKIFGTANDD